MMVKRKYRLKWKNIIIFLFLIISLIIVIISIIHLVKWSSDRNKINDQVNKVQNIANINEVNKTDDTEIIKQDNISKSDPYWDFIKMNLIDVDFKELRKVNKQVKGWIQVNGTNINYPFVQTNDNKYYLTHSFNKEYNRAGWVFLDYRNKLNNNDKNTILYAHGRLDKTMFGSLKNILKSDWLNNTNNYIVRLSTEYENTLWQVFSVYRIPTTSDYLQIEFNNKDFVEFSDKLISRSDYDFKTTINQNDRILTLSTCYNKNERVVLHAKLIKRQTKNRE